MQGLKTRIIQNSTHRIKLRTENREQAASLIHAIGSYTPRHRYHPDQQVLHTPVVRRLQQQLHLFAKDLSLIRHLDVLGKLKC